MTDIYIPQDKDGKALAWPDPDGSDWYIDAWNGIYTNRDELLREIPHWIAKEEDRVLAYGEAAKSADEAPWSPLDDAETDWDGSQPLT